jgi:Tfp pilus assembly protein PilO
VTGRQRRGRWLPLSRLALFFWLLGGNLALFGSFTLPRGLQARSMGVQAQTLGAEVQRERAAVARLRARAAIIEGNTRDEAALLARLPDEKEGLPKVMGEIERLAQEAGARPGSRTFAPEPMRNVPLVRMGISLPLSGRYAQVVRFLTLLEASGSFIVVERVQLRENSGAASLDVALSAYFRGDAHRTQGRK